MSTQIISDLHLAPYRPTITEAFCTFLHEECQPGDNLYILGDLFEAWIGDDDPSPLSRLIIDELAQLQKRNIRLYVQHGNRDFLMGKRFARETNAVLLPTYKVIHLLGKPVLLCHGDSLCVDDSDYIKFRRKTRNPIYRWFLGHLPLQKRLAIATEWREKSAHSNRNKPQYIMDVNQAEVESQMLNHQVFTLIHGHTHRPNHHYFHIHGLPAERIVLGDWDASLWWISDTSGEIILYSKPIRTEQN